MSALSDRLEQARVEGRAALIGYLPAGFPSVEGAIAAMRAMVEGGVDIIEIGLPYSDPLMDGEAIQRAVAGALAAGTKVSDTFRTVEAIAVTGAPALVMSYWNPIERFGTERFAAGMRAAGGTGVITPDLLPDEASSAPSDWFGATDATELDRIFLVAPSSTEARIAMTVRACRGFVYAASTMGVTGIRASVSDAARSLVQRVRAVGDLPVCVGLGVSTAEQAAEVAAYADGVIVGSAFVRLLLDAPTLDAGVQAVRELAAELAHGVRHGSHGPQTAAPVQLHGQKA